ncbi:MAG: protoporphyrinogen oxidase [Kofleriaceae bacterium]
MQIAVVGAGLGGLTAARGLRMAGHTVKVFEATPRAGGVIGTSVVDGYRREHAASSFTGGPPHGALALCEELGVPVEKAAKAARGRYIFIDGKLKRLPGSPVAFVRSDLLTWRGKLDLLKEPFVAAHPRGDDESMYAFASRRLGPQAARALVAPFVTGVYAADAHDVSLEAGFPRLAALDAEGGIVRGMLKTHVRAMLAARRGGGGAPRTERGLYAPVGGLGALTAALTKDVDLAAPVKSVAAASRGVVVDGERFDGCVLAVPASDAAPIVVGMPELVQKLSVFERAPVAVVYLGVPADKVPGDAFGFLTALGEELRVLGVVFESTVWTDRAPSGHALLRCIFGGARDPSVTEFADDRLIAQAVQDVSRALGSQITPDHTSVVRWAKGLPKYPVGHRERVRDATAVARNHRIVLAGADYRGPAVNDLCADAATIVAEVAAWT